MLELFLKRTKGSITVMVTLLLIPTIFFTGFLTDLARIKLGSNQAIMAADNYGEAILTEYDYLLKELYGLFAISQSDEGMQAVEDLQKYMKSSFTPSADTIKWDHLAGFTGFMSGKYEGCMPYKSADVDMDYKLIENSKLNSQEILGTQVGDFMKFRIVQEFMDTDIKVLTDALEQGQQAEKDSVVIDAKSDFDEAVGKLMEAMKEYYDVLREINHYPNYIENINTKYNTAKTEFSNIANSGSYKTWREYVDNDEAIANARSVPEDERSEEDKKFIEMGDAYDNDPDARAGVLLDRFEAEVDKYETYKDDSMIDFQSFNSHADDLTNKALNVKSKMETAQEERNKLEAALSGGATAELKKGIEESIKIFDELVNGEYSSQCYIDLAAKVSGNKGTNSDYELAMMNQIYQLEQIRSDYVSDPAVAISSYKEPLDLNKYDDFQKNSKYKTLYLKLVTMFENKSGEAEKRKQQQNAANEAKQNAEDKLKEEETTDARNIPDSINIGVGGTGGGASITDLMKSATSYFKMNSFGEAGNKLLLKFYMSAYDYGMFSNRVTNVKEPEAGETKEEAVSLTGIKMCRSVNYLYQAEMEYLYGGHKKSVDNLNAARNSILAFRAIVNMTSTYSISKINSAILAVCAPLEVFPPLAIALEAVLRLTVATIETAADWNRLKKGESVVLVKQKIVDLEGIGALMGLLGVDLSGTEEKSKPALDYNQYLLVMLTFLTTSDQVAKRTGDLITLNVNAVQQEVGEDGALNKLEFDINNAYTAVEASCTAHINFIVMPDSFAKKTLDASTYDSLTSYEKNKYKFTVTRGY